MNRSTNDRDDQSARARRAPRARLTTAGRLLAAIEERGTADLARLAWHLGVPQERLAECRDGVRPLDVEVQIRLATLVLTVAPEHGRLARQLEAQAQSALRVEQGAVSSHRTYVGITWR